MLEVDSVNHELVGLACGVKNNMASIACDHSNENLGRIEKSS